MFVVKNEFRPSLVSPRSVVARYDDDGALLTADILPIGDLAGVNVFELGDRQVFNRIRWMDDRNNPVPGHNMPFGLRALFAQLLFLLFLHIARGHGDIADPILQGVDPDLRSAALEIDFDPRFAFLESI